MDIAWNQKWEYDGRIFNALLFFASEEGMQFLPNGEAEILAPLAAATVEYLGGDASKVPAIIHSYDYYWWKQLNDAVKKSLNTNSRNLDEPLKTFLCELLTVEWKSDHGESWWESGVRSKLEFRQLGFGSTFSLTHPEVLKIQENIKSHITPADLEHCKQIGLLMRKRILTARAAQ